MSGAITSTVRMNCDKVVRVEVRKIKKITKLLYHLGCIKDKRHNSSLLLKIIALKGLKMVSNLCDLPGVNNPDPSH